MPRLLVDLLFYTGAKGGMESYVRNLYRTLGEVAPNYDVIGLVSRELAELDTSWFPGTIVNSGISGENRASWARGELMAVPAAARKLGADLVHAPANFGPARSRVPVVLTIHDLLPFRHPEWVPGAYAPVLRGLIRSAARAATGVVTVSAASAHDIETILRVPAPRIDVVPLAGGDAPTAARGQRREGRLLSLGNRMPHKNFGVLLEALALIPTSSRPHLTITGGRGDDPLARAVARLGLADDVTLLGWVPDDALERLYAESSLVVFPTLFEGFGLPVLEAMSRGCPVLCSDLPVLREIGADAVAYVDPTEPAALAGAIRSLLADRSRRALLSDLGRERASRFTWTATALGTARAFQRALDARRSPRAS